MRNWAIPALLGAIGFFMVTRPASAAGGLLASAALSNRENSPSTTGPGLSAVRIGSTSATLQSPRFELQRPLPMLPGVMMDMELNGRGLALQMARAKGLQARILWIDCTANIERYNSEEKIIALMIRIKDAGFNTVVFDVKPISGQVAYPSKFAPKLEEWKGRKLPKDFDPLKCMVREAKANKLWFFVSMNAFSEGHRDFKVGPGYDWPDRQTVLYEAQPIVRLGELTFPILTTANVMPDRDDVLGCFTDASKFPQPKDGQFAISVGKDSAIVDGFEFGGSPPRVPTIPAGGSVLFGAGKIADYLRTWATPGVKVAFDSLPQFLPISERPDQQIPLMMNPNHPRVRDRALAMMRELGANYPIDGALYDDRLRYAGMNADFSEVTRAQFEKKVGKKLNWPDDVFKYTFTPDFTRGMSPGPFFQEWLTWRAATLQDYVAQAKKALQSVRPNALFGVYAGSWYGEYSAFGANYGAPELDAGFWYLTPEYRQTGFAPLLDFLITGCYYTTATIHEAMQTATPIGFTIEYAAYLSNQVARDQTWTYAGIMLSQFQNNPQGLMNALQAACGSTEGVMVFDLSHGIDAFWDVFMQAFATPATAPHAKPLILKEVRRMRLLVDMEMWRRDPVVIVAGQMGAGH